MKFEKKATRTNYKRLFTTLEDAGNFVNIATTSTSESSDIGLFVIQISTGRACALVLKNLYELIT